MKFKTLNDKTFEAANLREAAEMLWQMVLVPEATIEEWMVNSARRAWEWDHHILRTTSPEEHVEDMIAAGLLTVAG